MPAPCGTCPWDRRRASCRPHGQGTRSSFPRCTGRYTGIEDLPVAVRAPDLLRLLQGRRAAKQHAHGHQSEAHLVTFAHVQLRIFKFIGASFSSCSGVTGAGGHFLT